MLEVDAAEITSWIGRYMWPFFRISACLMAMPVIGTQLIPGRIKIALAFLITIVIGPLIPEVPHVEGISLEAALIAGQQLLIGVAMGFSLQFLFQLFVVGGQMIAMQMGMGFASIVDPANGVSVTVLSQLFLILVTLLFLSMNGHGVLIEVLVESFYTLPIGVDGLGAEGFHKLAMQGVWMLGSAVLIALPAVTSILVVNLTFGVMTRAAPQLNIFAIGFPMTMTLGLVVTWITSAGILSQYHQFSQQSLSFLRSLVGA